MLLPIRLDIYGHWHFTGYEGLASHGGTVGIILALLLYSKNLKVGMWTVLDTISIAVPVTACFIRLGNLMNSEIIGKPTDLPWAFIFERIDMIPRHPGQLYEAIAYACFFFVLWYFYKKKRHISSLIMALLLEILQKSEKTYAIDRGFYGFCQYINKRKLNYELCIIYLLES